MPYVKRTASGRIASVYDRPSREAKERVRANDPELLRFLGLAPTQTAAAAANEILVAPGSAAPRAEPPDLPPAAPEEAWDRTAWDSPGEDADRLAGDDAADDDDFFGSPDSADAEWADPAVEAAPAAPAATEARPKEDDEDRAFGPDDDAPTIDIEDDALPANRPAPRNAAPARTAPATKPAPPTARPAAKQAPAARPAAPQPAGAPKGNGQRGNGGGETAARAAAEGDGPEGGAALRQLDASDMEMARITEDLIDLLIGRNIINFTDFPTMAQRKLITRRALRSNMSALTNLVSDEENIF